MDDPGSLRSSNGTSKLPWSLRAFRPVGPERGTKISQLSQAPCPVPVRDIRSGARHNWEMARWRRTRLFPCLTLLGGILIAVGSQWRFTASNQTFSSRPSGPTGPTAITAALSPSLRQVSLSSWALLTLIVGAIVLCSLAADAAIARPSRESVGWGMLLIASLLSVFVGYVGLWTEGTTLSVGIGYPLAAAGCALVIVGSALWTNALHRRRLAPR